MKIISKLKNIRELSNEVVGSHENLIFQLFFNLFARPFLCEISLSINYRKEKNQYLEVNFNDRVVIRRLSTQGRVKSLAIFYSDDGVIFEHYKQGREGEVKDLLLGWTREIPFGHAPYYYFFFTRVFVLYFKDLKANNNENYGTVILLPVPVEAVFVRINPTAWQTSGISLKGEFYGCKLSQPVIPGNCYLFSMSTLPN